MTKAVLKELSPHFNRIYASVGQSVKCRFSATCWIEPGSPWENGYNESCNGKLRDELLHGEIFYTLKEAQILIAPRRRHYQAVRPHSSNGCLPPAPEALEIYLADPGYATLRRELQTGTLTPRPT